MPTTPEPTPQADPRREQLLEAMSGVSQERWCAGWMTALDRRLHAEGGIWETLGRAVGWPTGDYQQCVWVSWEEAGLLYGHAITSTQGEEAHPTKQRWYIEIRDGIGWDITSRFHTEREAAVRDLSRRNLAAPQWQDGRPVHRRMVRETTTHAVEQTAPASHVGGNAEDCPACSGTNPPYPFICPGPDAAPEPGQES